MTTIFTLALTANDPGYTDYSTRNILPITGGAADQIRVTFEADSGVGLWVDNAAIGISIMADFNDAQDQGETTAVPTELLFGGVSGFNISAGQSITSDWVNFAGFTSSKLLVVVIDYHSSAANPRIKTGLGNVNAGGTMLAYKPATNSYNSSAALGGTSLNGQVNAVNLIEVQSAAAGGQAPRTIHQFRQRAA